MSDLLQGSVVILHLSLFLCLVREVLFAIIGATSAEVAEALHETKTSERH